MANIKRANTSGITKSGVAIPDVPDAPTIGAATNVGTARAFNNGSATVAFTAAATGGTSTSFTATSTPGSFTATGAGSPLTVTGLQSDTAYTFAVTATNATATGPASSSSSSITATTIPAAPTIGTPTVGSGQSYTGSANVSVPFTAGATGGAAISSYTVTSSSGGTATGASSPITISDTVGTARTYTVTATNVNGTSTASSASASTTPVSVPQAPTIGTVTLSGTTASVPFTANATGGSAVSTFTATSSPGGLTGTGSTPISVSGLTAGTAYTFTVTATNAQGTSAASSASNSVTPVSYFTMGWGSYYPYGVSARPTSGGFGLTGYASGPGVGNALVSSSGTLATNKYVTANLSNGNGPQLNAYGIDSSDNAIWLSGTSNNPYIFRHDSILDTLWQKRFVNGYGYSTIYWRGAVYGKDGNMYCWLSAQVSSNGGDNRDFFLKVNPSTGGVSWSKYFAQNIPIQSAAIDASGNVCIQFYNQQIIGYNSSGTQLFRKAMNGTFNNSGSGSSVADSAGNFYIKTADNSGNVMVVKVNSSGSIVWGRKISYPVSGYGASWSSGNGVLATDSSDNIYLAHNSNTAEASGCIVKFNSSGTTLWKRRLYMTNYASGGGMYVYSISVDSTNGLFYVCGQTIFGNPYGNVGWTFKLPVDGTKTSSSYDLLGGGFTMGYADSASLTITNLTDTSADNNSYGTITNGGSVYTTDSTLTFTKSSTFSGNTPVVTTI